MAKNNVLEIAMLSSWETQLDTMIFQAEKLLEQVPETYNFDTKRDHLQAAYVLLKDMRESIKCQCNSIIKTS